MVNHSLQYDDDFLNHRPIPRIEFEHNDSVRIISGDYAGKEGALVGIEEYRVDPLYRVELALTGFDILVLQSQIALIDE